MRPRSVTGHRSAARACCSVASLVANFELVRGNTKVTPCRRRGLRWNFVAEPTLRDYEFSKATSVLSSRTCCSPTVRPKFPATTAQMRDPFIRNLPRGKPNERAERHCSAANVTTWATESSTPGPCLSPRSLGGDHFRCPRTFRAIQTIPSRTCGLLPEKSFADDFGSLYCRWRAFVLSLRRLSKAFRARRVIRVCGGRSFSTPAWVAVFGVPVCLCQPVRLLEGFECSRPRTLNLRANAPS